MSATKNQRATTELAEILDRHERRANYVTLVGDLVPDNNFRGRLLLVTDKDTYYSIERDDIVETEPHIFGAHQVLLKQGAIVWHCRRTRYGFEQSSLTLPLEAYQAPMPMRRIAGAPDEGQHSDQDKLASGTTIEGAAKLFVRACEGRDQFANNCAHFLSNAFILTGFDELLRANDCIDARCDTKAKRPIRAKDMLV